jgi:hypothetical protein
VSLFQVKHNHCLTNPLAVAALWSDEEGRPVLDAALDVFLTRPRHTSRKEVSISFDEVQHKKKERSYVNMVTLVLQVLHSLCSGKDMMMKTPIDAKEQPGMAAHTETIVTDEEGLAGRGFTSEDIVSLLWLQRWYQTGGSDRVVLLRHWEFLKFLVLNGTLDMEDGVCPERWKAD